MGTIKGNQFISSYLGDQIDALLAAMAQANPLPSGTDWVAFIDDCRAAQTAAEAAQEAAESSASGAASSASTASTQATQATIRANAAQSSATLSQSWAVGGTGTRTGENTNNAKYWSEQAQHAAGGGVTSFNNRSGVVLPQSGDYTPDMVGAVPVIGKGINLLDNAYFIGGGSQQGGGKLPINQGGNTTLNGAGYICNRWYQRFSSPTTKLTANGIKSENNSGGSAITQNFENGGAALSGQPLTLSALFQNAGLVWGSCASFDPTKSLRIDGRNGGSFVYNSKTSGFPNQVADIRIPQNDYLIAARLEFGDTQTLARQVNGQWVLNDPAPDYQTELKKCQFSQQVIRNADANSPRCIAMGMTTTVSGTTVFPLNLSPMRVNVLDSSTITINGDTIAEVGPLYATNGSGTVRTLNASNMSVNFCPDSGLAELRVSGLTDFTRGTPLTLWLNAGASITLDANI